MFHVFWLTKKGMLLNMTDYLGVPIVRSDNLAEHINLLLTVVVVYAGERGEDASQFPHW
jgi:hypothetical protein